MKSSLPVCHIILAAGILLSTGLRAAQILPDAPDKVTPLTVGSAAPTGVLTTTDGPYNLGEAIARKPTILVFYRANWCGLGKRALAELRDNASIYEAIGFQIIAVSVDTPESLRPAIEKNRVNYTLLSDRGLSLASAYGIAFRAPKELVSSYARKGISLPSIPDEGGASGLLIPTVFIVDRHGIIRWVYSDPQKNPTSHELLAAAMKART
jgi:peroxiredoxin